MPFSPDDFYKRMHNIGIRGAGLKNYISDADAPGFMTPPVEMNETVRAKLADFERRYDAVLERQGTPRNAEYIELSSIKDRTVRENMAKKFRDLIGLEEALNHQGTGTLIGESNRPYYFDRLDPSKPLDEIGVYYQQVTKQFIGSELGFNEDSASKVKLSGRLPRLSVAERIVAQVNGDVSLPDRYATFDIETTGLDAQSNKVWQVSIRGSDGLEKNVFFDFDSLGTTKSGTMRDTLLQGVKTSPIGDIKQVLQTLDEYPALIGQNLSFDISFLLNSLTQNKELMGDPEFVGLLDNLRAKAGTAAVWDTNQLGRNFLPDMKLATELDALSHARLGRATPFSMENIILETNLLEIMNKKHGISAEEMLSKLDGSGTRRGLHYADVDTFFEDYYWKEISELMRGSDDPDAIKLAYKKGGFVLDGLEPEYNDLIRSEIIRTHAITPYTAMGYDQVDPAVLKALQESGGEQYVREVDIGRLGQFKGVAITPAEHQIIQSHLQNMGQNLADDLPLDAMLKGVKAHQAIVSSPLDSLPTVYQQQLDDLGIPYASLSREERILSEALTGTLDRSTAIDALLPRGQWQGKLRPEVVGNRVRRLVLPMDILKQAEEAGVFNLVDRVTPEGQFDRADDLGQPIRRTALQEGGELLRLSGFEYDQAGQIAPVKDVSTNFLFSYDEKQAAAEITRLKQFLIDKQAELGIDRAVIDEIDTMSNDSLHKYGVQVGTALRRDDTGRVIGGVDEAARLHDELARASGGIMVDNTDMNTMAFGVRVMEDADARGNIISGPVTAAKGSEAVYQSQYTSAMERTRDLLDKTRGTRSNDAVVASIMQSATGKETMPFKIQKAMDNATKIYRKTPNSTKGAIAASAAVAGYYLYRKRQKSQGKFYEEPFEQQDYESEDFYQRYQADLGISMAGQYNKPVHNRADPLGTANVVRDLDANRIRHTKMGPNKDSHLFGGSY